MDYKLIRSNRRTIAIEVRPEGVFVRAPYVAPLSDIERLLREKAEWIADTREKVLKAAVPVENPISIEELRELMDRALKYIPGRVRYYAQRIGVTYGRITIRNQRSRWGSCSAKGNLNFNCLLMLMPKEVIDSVVVHELCHRKVMNHSEDFYREVLKVYPDYRKWDQWLKENGENIMRRMTG